MWGKRSKEEKVEIGGEAKRLLEHPLIQEFFTRAQESLYRQWLQPMKEDGTVKDIEDRERIYQQLQGLEAFQQFFRKLIIDASMAEKDLKE